MTEATAPETSSLDAADPAPIHTAPRLSRRLFWGIVAGLLALYAIVHVLLISRFPWFVDEGIYGAYAQLAEGDRTQRFVSLYDGKGQINDWIAVLLVHVGVTPIVAMRLISVAAGVVTAVGTGIVVRSWRNERDGLIAFAIALFIPYLFISGVVGVLDEFIAAGSMVALGLQLSISRKLSLERALLLGLTFGFLLLSKPTGAIAIALTPLALAVFPWREPQVFRRLLGWAGLMLLALVMGVAMYSIVKLSPLSYLPQPNNHRSLHDLFRDPFELLGTVGPDALRAVLFSMTPPFLVVAVWGVVRAAATRDPVGIILTVWVVAAMAAFLLLTDHGYPRYGLQVAGPLVGLGILGGSDLFARARRRWSLRTAQGIVAAVMLWTVVLDLWIVVVPGDAPYPGLDRRQYVTGISNRQPTREAAQRILTIAPKAFTAATPVQDRTVALLGGWPEVAQLVLNGPKYPFQPRFSFLSDTSPAGAVNAARYVILEEPKPTWLNIPDSKIVKTWTRPGNGQSTVLYDRGALPPAIVATQAVKAAKAAATTPATTK